MANKAAPQKELAGLFRQILIILWKNLLLYSKNKMGIACEILFSSLFTFVFIVLVYFSNPTYSAKSFEFGKDIISSRIYAFTAKSQNQTFYYYPNNSFVEQLVTNSYNLIKSKNPLLSVNLMGTEFPNAEQFNQTAKSKLFALVSFPSDFTGINALPDNIQYSIYTREYVLF